MSACVCLLVGRLETGNDERDGEGREERGGGGKGKEE